jgi:hypothetical protein
LKCGTLKNITQRKGEVEMEFYKNSYGEEMGKDQFMSLQSLIKNGGLWKSEKQGKFILWKWTQDEEFVKDCWIAQHGVYKEGMKYVIIDGFYSFGHGHGRGHRPALFLYELDSLGVVARYKGKYVGDVNNGGTSLDKVILDWERETPAQPLSKAPEAPERVKSNSKHVGSVGERLKGLEVTVTFVKQFESEWGISTLHKFVDAEGNIFTWFSSSKVLELGNKYRMNAGIKKHEEYKEEKQTVLTRCMKIEEL